MEAAVDWSMLHVAVWRVNLRSVSENRDQIAAKKASVVGS